MNTFSDKIKTYLSLGLRVFTNSKTDSNGESVNNAGDNIPWTKLSKSISRARFAIISTAGIHLLSQESFNKNGEADPSYREIYAAELSAENRLVNTCSAPGTYENDVKYLFPVENLNELATTEKIGFANYRHFSFYGHLFGYRLAELVHGHLPKVINSLRSDEVDIVILTSGCRRCDHTMRIIQRVLESAGLVTISITNFSSKKNNIAVPRSLYVEPVSKRKMNDKNEKLSNLDIVVEEVLKHLTYTDKPGLQSFITKDAGRDVETDNTESSKKNRHGINESVLEPFGRAHNQSEGFAWEAFVKYY